MKDFKILKFLDKLRPVFEKLGVEYLTMRKILQIKLIMDGRRVPTVFNNKNNETEGEYNFIKSLGIYLLMGLILIPFVIMKQNYIYQMSTVFVMIMFFVMTSLISDFSSVLLDIKDKNIIGTRPVSPKTLRFAKTIHVTLYMFYITLALTGPALIISLFKQGLLFFIIFLISIILLDVFIIVLTSLVYFLILKFFDGEKLKDIINYVQIMLSIVLMIGYQFLGRLFNIVDLVNIRFVPKWWQYFIVPIWFAAPFQIIKKAQLDNNLIVLSIMALVVPIIAITIYIKLMPIFEDNLQKLNNNSGKNNGNKRPFFFFVSKLVCRNNEERVFFKFASDMMKNEREFKLKVYPSLGFAIAFPFIFFFQQLSFSSIKDISSGKSYFFIYFCGLMLPTIMLMIRYSERYKGAWVYKILPITNLANVFKGTIKAFMIRLFLPLFIIEAMIFILIFGVRIIPNMIIILLNIMIFNILCFIANSKILPFSEAYGAAQQGNRGFLNLMLMILLAIMGGIHYIFTNIPYGIYIYLALVIIINLVLWKLAFNNISLNKE